MLRRGSPADRTLVSDEQIRVVIVDDHELVRAGLRGVLDGDPAITVVAEASDGVQALASVRMHSPNVVVMDLQMPGMGGVEATRRITTEHPDVAVLVLTMYDDDDSVFAALRAGARGYLLKGSRRSELRAAVVAVAERQSIFGPGVADRILERTFEPFPTANRFPSLTPRESDVLNALSEGHQPAEIARQLHITEKTVRNNIATILTKLQVTTRAAAIQLARDGRNERPPPGESA